MKIAADQPVEDLSSLSFSSVNDLQQDNLGADPQVDCMGEAEPKDPLANPLIYVPEKPKS